MKNKEYRTRFTSINSCLVDCYKLREDLTLYCKKVDVGPYEFLSARGICSTILPKSVRSYYSYDKGMSNKEYDKLYSEGKIPRACTSENKIGRIKNYALLEICKAIKKKPGDYILINVKDEVKEIDSVEKPKEITKEQFAEHEENYRMAVKELIEEATSPLLTELRIANTYLERLLVAWGA